MESARKGRSRITVRHGGACSLEPPVSLSGWEACPVSNFSYTIQVNTPYKTTVHRIEAKKVGPSTVVISGMYADEAAGYAAAARMLDWQLKQGMLVVIPEADVNKINNYKLWKLLLNMTIPEIG